MDNDYLVKMSDYVALEKENERLKENWNELKAYLLDKIDRSWEIEEQCYEDIYEQMQELEKDDSND